MLIAVRPVATTFVAAGFTLATLFWRHLTIFALTVMLALTVVATDALHAQGNDDNDACMNDAMTVCSQFIPDRERVARCLMANRSRISPACRVALKRFK